MNSELFTATNVIVAITCVVSLALMNNREAKTNLIFHPVTIKHQHHWYRFLSSGLIHADLMHLLINMFVFWSFGNAIEKAYYPHFLGENSLNLYLLLYFGGIAVASIPSFIRHHNNPNYAALGASGGVSAVVFAIILFAPWQNLYLFGVIALPQILAGVAYLAYSWIKDQRATDNIGHMAHFTGALWGLFFTMAMEPSLLNRFVELTLAGPSWLN